MKVIPEFLSNKWGWVLRKENTKSVLYDGIEMLSWSTKEEAIQYAKENGYEVVINDMDD